MDCVRGEGRQADRYVLRALGRGLANPLSRRHEYRLSGRDVERAALGLHAHRTGERDGVLVELRALTGFGPARRERIRATLARSSPVLARPVNSSIVFGGCPAASTRTGDPISSAIALSLG